MRPVGNRVSLVIARIAERAANRALAKRVKQTIYKTGWSVKSVGEWRLGELAKCMIERDFRGSEGSEAVRFSHGDFGFVVQSLDDAAGELFSCTEVVEDQISVCAHRPSELLHRLASARTSSMASFILATM